MLPLARNPRAKMQGITDGFVKLFCRKGYGTVLGGVVVAPQGLRADLSRGRSPCRTGSASTRCRAPFTVYPSLSGSIAEAARQLHQSD